MNRLTQKEFEKRVKDKQEGQYKALSEYKNKDSLITVECLDCGLTWSAVANTFLRQRVGKDCKHHVKLTPRMAKKRVESASYGKISMLGDYKGAAVKAEMCCNVCGYRWETKPTLIFHGHGCPLCSGKAPVSLDRFLDYIKINCPNEYKVIGEFKSRNDLIKIRHISCGREFMMRPHNFMNGQRCPFEARQRAGKSNAYSLEKMQSVLNRSTRSRYEIVSSYKNANSNALLKDKKCGNTFLAHPGQLSRGETGCPYCSSSKGEKAVRNYLKQHHCDFKEQVKFEDCKNEKPLPFDFAVYENGVLYCLIEYQGFQHYFPSSLFDRDENEFKNRKARDKIKEQYCLKNNIKLLKIPYKSERSSQNNINKVVNNYLNEHMPIPNQA